MLAADDRRGGLRYRRSVNWRQRLTARLRSFDPAVVDVVVAAVFTVGAIATVFLARTSTTPVVCCATATASPARSLVVTAARDLRARSPSGAAGRWWRW